MAIPKSAVVIVALIALAGSGCTQPDPNAKPTYACTPSQGGTPQPCYKAEHDLQASEDALYAEAEAVYRRFLTEEERIYRAGGATTASPVMLETLTGEALKERAGYYLSLHENETRVVGGKFILGYLRRAPQAKVNDSVATWESCTDTRSVVVHVGRATQRGRVVRERAFFSETENGIRIIHLSHFNGEVNSCA